MADRRIVDATALPVYDLGQDHPFARDRQQPLFDLLHTTGLVRPEDVLPTTPASIEQLAAAHDRRYLEILRATSVPQPSHAAIVAARHYGLGPGDNPIATGQFEAAAAVGGAALAAVDAIVAGRCRAVFHPAGGLHHAMPNAAAGFCLVNDLVLAIHRARAAGLPRVLYVDFDVHHGDGVEFAFAADPSVLTLSFHETPEIRYPGTGYVTDRGRGDGFGYALNVPLHPYTADDSWLECVRSVLPAVARAFAPDLIVSQHGCDAHRDDPLATIDCTTRSLHAAAQLTRELADELCGGRWLATGGGGYRPYHVIPRAWAMVWSSLSGRPLPPRIDEGWRRRWQGRAGSPLPTEWYDDPHESPAHALAAAVNQRTVAELLAGLDWL
ncbi:MAG TPA: acetoin utilization protein AcuC [Planctomycetota bacterium]|nr:acetoin utilization protein AcuC [Planctomycetota bacterium]